MTATTVLPIRSFDGLSRLASVLNDEERSSLMRRLAQRTADAAAQAGTTVTVVSGDAAVRAWTAELGYDLVDEPEAGGLDGAAATGIAGVDDRWVVIHADLPTIGPEDVTAAADLLEAGRTVLAPSHDGGTSLIGGVGPTFPFAYGVGSFRRHAARAPEAAVLVRPGLALDLDRVRDLAAFRTLASL